MTRRNGPKPEPTDGLKVGDIGIRYTASIAKNPLAIQTVKRITKTLVITDEIFYDGGIYTECARPRTKFSKATTEELAIARRYFVARKQASDVEKAAQAHRESDPKYQLVRYMGGVENVGRGWDVLTLEQLQQIKDWLLSVPPF